MTLRAPAKLNLCLYLGPRRGDGLHEIRSLFCPLTLADRIVVSDADADQVVCPGVEGPNLAEEALAALRARGWRALAGEGGDREAHSGRGRARRGQRRRSGAPAPGAREVDGLAELAAELGADVPSQLDPAFALVGGAGEAVEPLPPPGEFAVVLLPADEGLRTADVYAEADRLGLGRDLAELDAIAERLRAAAARAPRRSTTASCWSTTWRGGAVAAARDRRGARGARGGGGAGGAGRRVGPDGVWAVRRHRRRRPGSRGAAAAPCERDRGGARDEPMSANGGQQRRSHLPLLIGVAVAIGRFVVLNRVLPEHRPPGGARGHLVGAGRLDLCPGGTGGLPGDRRLRRAGAPRRDGGDPRRRGRRAGRDLDRADDRGRLGCALAGDSVSFLLGRRLGREFLLRHGPRVRITPERFARVEGYFARHGGKTILIGRFIGLVRALAPFVAGSSGMRYGYYLPFSVLGTGLWAATFGLIGYLASQSLDAAAEAAGRGTLLFGIAVGVIVGIVVAVRFLRVAGESQAAGGGDGAPRGAPPAACGGAPGGPAGALPVGAGDARAARARVHDPARGARRQPLRGGRLHGGRSRAIRGRRRATARRSTSPAICGRRG